MIILVEHPAPPRRRHFKSVCSYDVGAENDADLQRFISWANSHMPPFVRGGKILWDWTSYPPTHRRYALAAHFSSRELAARFKRDMAARDVAA